MEKIFLSEPAVFCCCGKNSKELWESAVCGNQNGIRKVTAMNGKEFFAARIADSLLEKPSTARYDMRIMRIEEQCLLQLEQTVEKAKQLFGASRIGVCVGSCDNGSEFSVAGHRKYFSDGVFSSDYSLEIQGADYVSTFVAEKFDLKGPCMTFSTACSSSAGAIIKASELIRAGICDAIVAGGVDIASDTALLGFDALEAVAAGITNPFSKNRHGITLGDAAAFFVVSKNDLCGTEIELLGYGESADAYHMTSPDPSGDGAKRAMERALKNAGLTADNIDYLNLHGTGTKFNDSMEGKAVAAVFGDFKVPCSTTKPLTGHTLGAAGALEAAICFEAVRQKEGKLPVQVWDEVQDEDIPELNIIGKDGFKKADGIKACMSNSFAFGGSNVSLIVGRR